MLTYQELLKKIESNFGYAYNEIDGARFDGAIEMLENIISKEDPFLLTYVYRKLLDKNKPFFIIMFDTTEYEEPDEIYNKDTGEYELDTFVKPPNYTELISVLYESEEKAQEAAQKCDFPTYKCNLTGETKFCGMHNPVFERFTIKEI